MQGQLARLKEGRTWDAVPTLNQLRRIETIPEVHLGIHLVLTVLHRPLLLQLLILPRLILIIFKLVQIDSGRVGSSGFWFTCNEVSLLTHCPQFILNLPQHLDSVSLVLMRDP